ncbi:hypothetical protein [Legionella hackeliae]|nr:hypothetical protein [Legionella hackeliae]
MSSGIIISTQSPLPNPQSFPCTGGTAYALNKATNLPIFKMHRNAQVHNEIERAQFGAIANNSIIYITGHGDETADSLGGQYLAANSIRAQHINWKIESYADLICSNANLKEGDHITIVLWACFGGAGSEESTAAQLGRHLKARNINSTIISSTAPLERFDGKYSRVEKEGDCLKFRTPTRAIRVFKFSEKPGFEEWHTNQDIYFDEKGCTLSLLTKEDAVKEAQTSRDLLHDVDRALKNSPYYRDSFGRDKTPEDYLREHGETFLLRKSNTPYPGYFTFSVTYKGSDNKYYNTRYVIDGKGNVFGVDAKTLELIPKSIEQGENWLSSITKYYQNITHSKEIPRQPQSLKK